MDENPKLVHIKRVDIKGFKTFQNKISLSLDKGLTAISGPNGSGKSNLMDAIKFALGELSPKELRGSSFEDVISKTISDNNLKSAYVAIQFDNTDRRIPIDSDHITVSRQYVRGGEGVYRVNGKRVSRRQIHDALSSTGISVSGINMIPQGAVTRLAEITVDERRKIIEDVVGIGIFDEKKEEAKTHLQHAEINIKVASAKVEEVRSRVESLEKERNDLVRSRFLKKEIKELQAKIVSHRIISIEEELSKMLEESRRLKNLVDQIRNEKESLENEKQSLDKVKNEFEEDRSKLTQELFVLERKMAEVTVDAARKNVELKETRKKIKDLLQTKEKNFKEKNELTAKIDEIKNKLDKLKLDRKILADKYAKLDIERQTILTKIKDNKNAITGFLAEIGKLDKLVTRSSEEKMRIETSVNHERHKLGLLKSKIKEVELSSKNNDQQISTLKEKLEGSLHEIEKQKMNLEKTRKKIEETQIYFASKKDALKEAQATFEKAKEAKLRIQAEKKASEDTDQGNEAYTLILKLIKAGKIHGIKGKISSLIRIKSGFKHILELASEGWLNAMLVEDLNAAISCTDVLNKKKCGRLKIIPLTRIITTKPISLDISDKDLVGRAVDLIECSEEIRPAINFILGDTVIVKTRALALIMSLSGYRAVTLDGDIFNPEGLIETGYRKDLNLWEEIEEDEVKNLEKLMSDLHKLMIPGGNEVSKLGEEINELKRIEFQKENNLLNLQQEMENCNNRIIQMKEHHNDYVSLKNKLNRELTKQKNKISELYKQNSIEETKLSELFSKKKSLMRRIKKNGMESWEKEVSDQSIQLDKLRAKIHEVDKTMAVSSSELEYAFERNGELQLSFNETEEEIKQGESIVDRLQTEMNEASKEVKKLKNEKKVVAERNLNMDRRRESNESELRKVEEELKRVFKLIEENSLTLTQLREQIREREIEKSFLLRDLKNLGFETPIEVDGFDIEKRQEIITLFNKELDEIGAVNELAEEQYSEYMGNYQQLSSKINELEEEKIEILGVMSELEQEKRKAFLEAFKRVERNFSGIFSRITDGGSGRLILENEEDPFSGGIEVKLKFPGKREFSISGASGGEKSVATVCFIIAMQAIQPMPFYFLDEIDAHLDPVNSQRLVDLLKERSRGCQFIVISLKDITISRADKVYGIFVEKGVSRVISLPLPEMAIRDGR